MGDEAGTLRVCARCGSQAPRTETDYTLIGSKHAWRCKKVAATEDSQARLEWYCPACWKDARAKSSDER